MSFYVRPGGELKAGEDEMDGLKRLMTEVRYQRYTVDN